MQAMTFRIYQYQCIFSKNQWEMHWNEKLKNVHFWMKLVLIFNSNNFIPTLTWFFGSLTKYCSTIEKVFKFNEKFQICEEVVVWWIRWIWNSYFNSFNFAIVATILWVDALCWWKINFFFTKPSMLSEIFSVHFIQKITIIFKVDCMY